MFGGLVRSGVITAEREATFRKRSEKLRERRRVFELYCSRAGPSDETADWIQDERKTQLCPLAGVESDGDEITITAAIPDIDGKHPPIDVFPGLLVAEQESAVRGSVERCSTFPLHCVFNPGKIRAQIRNGDLVVTAPEVGYKEPCGRNA